VTIPGLELTSPSAALAEQFLTWRHDPEVTRWFLQQRVDPAELVADWASYDGGDHHRVVALLGGQVVGQAVVGVVDGMGQSGHEEEFVEREGRLAYFVRPDHAGRGLATTMAGDALDNAFGRLGLRRVQAGCFADNVASWRVMEKLGMRREQHGVRDSFHAELGWIDGYTYAILAEEWHGRGD
jgi:RimJ/RimL family protein N-acetyltransferase